jgi:hypothetical protein
MQGVIFGHVSRLRGSQNTLTAKLADISVLFDQADNLSLFHGTVTLKAKRLSHVPKSLDVLVIEDHFVSLSPLLMR